jgi:hypothetical protein
VEKFGSPLAKATIGVPTTEPLSRRYEAIIRRKKEEAARQAEAQRQERERQRAAELKAEEERRADERRQAQVKAIQRKIDRGDIAPVTAAGALFTQPVKPIIQEAFLQQAIIQITTLYESWGIFDLCNADDVMTPARLLASSYEADRLMEAGAEAMRAAVKGQVESVRRSRLFQRYGNPDKGLPNTADTDEFGEETWTQATEAPTPKPRRARRTDLPAGASRQYYDKD